jgi:hypothetical protein
MVLEILKRVNPSYNVILHLYEVQMYFKKIIQGIQFTFFFILQQN